MTDYEVAILALAAIVLPIVLLLCALADWPRGSGRTGDLPVQLFRSAGERADAPPASPPLLTDIELAALDRGALLIVRVPAGADPGQLEMTRQAAARWLKLNERDDVIALVIRADYDLRTMDDRMLARLGLQRIPQDQSAA